MASPELLRQAAPWSRLARRLIGPLPLASLLLACSTTDPPPNSLGASGVGASSSAGTAGTASGAAGGSPGVGGASTSAAPEIVNKAIHRLSNLEYDNTLRDLTGTSLSFAATLPAEEAEGFDNIATALSMSPRQVEAYFVAARQVSADVFAQPALRARIVKCTPDESNACAQTVIADFGLRAYRRPLTAAESAGLLAKYDAARALGVDAWGALEHVVHIMLASPQFLYRIELDPDLTSTAAHPLDGYELASRLSYALWSSMPDEALLAKGASADLATPEGIQAEVDRMLADPKSEMLVKNFGAQWFGSRRLADHAASASIYPSYSPQLAASMQREMELYFAEFLNEERPYTEFLHADINFVDPTLAKFYGMPAPAGSEATRTVDTADERSGFLGLAGFLTHTSRETRTSPIIRGKWILDAFWCMALKLPENIVVAPLEEPADGAAPTTVRAQMEAHRISPTCSGCHNLIDPIGLALENFDGIGHYRGIYENGLPIDTKGVMPSGQMVDGLSSLADALGSDPSFLSCAASKFGTYALGLALPAADRDQIVARWTAGSPSLRKLIKETVTHESFRFRKAEGQ